MRTPIVKIFCAALACAAFSAAHAETLVRNGDKIAFLGDSITELGDWPAGYVNLVMAGLEQAGVTGCVKIAAGRSGDRSNRMLARIDGVLKRNPDWILISCGVNDVWHREHKGADGRHTGVDLPDYIANMRAMYDKSDRAGAKVVVLTSTMITENAEDQKNRWLVEYNDFLRDEAKKRGYLLVDLNAAMQAKLAEIRKTDKEPGCKLTKDGVHMNFKGDCMMAGAILKAFGVSSGIGDTLEKSCVNLVEIGRNLKGGQYTGANLSLVEHKRLGDAAKKAGKSEMDYALDLYLEGIELAATLGSLPPPAPAAPSRPIPENPAASVLVKDGAKVCFVGDYYTEYGDMEGRYVDQVMRGLKQAGVKKVEKIAAWQRWERSEDLLKRIDRQLAKKPDWTIFLVGNDDAQGTGGKKDIPLAETKANLTAVFDQAAATGTKAVVCTLRPTNGGTAYDDFLKQEAAKRGWLLADIGAAAKAAKVSLDYGVFDGHCLVAKTILAALGVGGDVADFVKVSVTETPGTDHLNIPTSMNQAKHVDDVFGSFASRPDIARDILVTLMDSAKRLEWEAQLPAPRRILSLKTSKNNGRNGEGDLIKLRDGSIYFVYTEYVTGGWLDHAPAHIVERRSSDGGATWTAPKEVFPVEGRQNDMSVSLLRLKDGRLAMVNMRKNSDSDCMPVIRFSSDEAKTWSKPVECMPAAEKDYYVCNNARLTQLESGRLLVPLARHSPKVDKGDKFKGRLSCVYSDDAGQTWKKSIEYIVKDAKGNRIVVQEPGLIQLKDGRLCMYVRTDEGCQWRGFSNDGGITWGDFGPSSLKGPRAPATVRRLADGRLLAVWNDHEGHPEYKDMGGWGRVPLTIGYSSDEGKTWTDKRIIEPSLKGFFCYIATLFDGDDLILHYYCRPCLNESCVTRVPGALRRIR